jgi:hypothetical protein
MPEVVPVMPAPAPAPVPQAAPSRPLLTVSVAMLGAMRAVALVLSVRLLLLLALIGAFWLGHIAMDRDSWLAFAVLVAYSALTVLPLVGLAWPSKPQGQ